MPVFLNPWALAGLTAIAIPLAIHLIRLRKREFEVPSLLLFTNFRKPSRKREIENVILMILRCLLIVCLVLLLARPVFRVRGESPSFRPEDSILVILFDNSVASAETFDGQRQFDSMKERLSEFLRTLPPDAKLILCGTVPGSTPSALMSPRNTLSLLESMESFFPVLPDYPGALQKIREILEKNADAFRTFALLFACPPLRESIRNLAAGAEEQGLSQNAWNALLPRTDSLPDPYLISAERIRDERNPGIRVFFTGDHTRLANAVLTVSEHGGKERNDRFSIPPEQIPDGKTEIPESRLSVDLRAPLVLGISSSSGKEGASGDRHALISPLAEYFLAPDDGGKKKTHTLILHDGSPESRSAVLLLHAALKNAETVATSSIGGKSAGEGEDGLGEGQRLLETFNYSSALSRMQTDSPDQIILPPVRSSNELLERLLEKAVSDGKTLMLFPQPGLPGFRVPGVEEKLQIRSLEPLRFGAPRKVELVQTPEIRREFFPLFSKGFSLASVEELIPFAEEKNDSILFRAGNKALLSRRPLPNGAELILWAVPFRNPPLTLVMNPLFPALLEKLLPAGQTLPDGQFQCTDLLSPADFLPLGKNGGFLTLHLPGGKSEKIRALPDSVEIPSFDLSQPGFYEFSSASEKNSASSPGKNSGKGKRGALETKTGVEERIIAVNCRRLPSNGAGREEIARILGLPSENEWIPSYRTLRSAPLPGAGAQAQTPEEAGRPPTVPAGEGEETSHGKDGKDGEMYFPVGFSALLLAAVLGAEMLFASMAGSSGGRKRRKEEWTA